MDKGAVSVIILTFNEEINIQACLESVKDLTDEIFIVDSFSTDRTLGIVREYTDKIYQNAWVHWAHQRNWAIDNLPISNEWVLFLDADERLTGELCQEIRDLFTNSAPGFEGFYIKRNFFFLGKRLKHGGYQSDFILRLFRKEKGRSIGSGAREYLIIQGVVGKLTQSMLHEDKKDITFWIDKHNKISNLEAVEILRLEKQSSLIIGKNDNEEKNMEHGFNVWLREKVWLKLPILIRPLFYFFYRYILQLGFLDGKEGLIYCFLHGFWYPFLVDAKYFELKKANEKSSVIP